MQDIIKEVSNIEANLPVVSEKEEKLTVKKNEEEKKFEIIERNVR